MGLFFGKILEHGKMSNIDIDKQEYNDRETVPKKSKSDSRSTNPKSSNKQKINKNNSVRVRGDAFIDPKDQ